MKIEVFGKGCHKCHKTYDMIKEALEAKGQEAELLQITDLDRITARGIMMTPAVVIDGQVKMEGKVPETVDIEGWLG